MFGIYHALIWEPGLAFLLPIGSNLLLCDRLNLILILPRTMVVVEVRPLAEVFQFPLGTCSLCDDTLDNSVRLIFFF
jgi:hypothetical protein